MKTTLKTLHDEIQSLNRNVSERMSEMIRSFAAVHVYIDNLEQRFEQRFERVDERFNEVDFRFNQINDRFDKIDRRFVTLKTEIINELTEVLGPHSSEIERTLDNHERRIFALKAHRHPPGNA